MLRSGRLDKRLQLDACRFRLRFGVGTFIVCDSRLATPDDSLASLELFKGVAPKHAWLGNWLSAHYFGQVRLVRQSISARRQATHIRLQLTIAAIDHRLNSAKALVSRHAKARHVVIGHQRRPRVRLLAPDGAHAALFFAHGGGIRRDLDIVSCQAGQLDALLTHDSLQVVLLVQR